jgi:hypothetical protein
MRWEGYVAYMEHKSNAFRPDGKKLLGTPILRWEDNIKIDLKEAGWEAVNLAQNRDQWLANVNMVMNLQGSQVALSFMELVSQSKPIS